jgi:hypothetical protein
MTAGVVDGDAVEHRLVRHLQAVVAQKLNREAQDREATGKPVLSREDEQQFAIALIRDAVAEHLQQQLLDGGEVPIDRTMDQRLAMAVYSAMFGAGELQALLDDNDVENIDINGCDEMWSFG